MSSRLWVRKSEILFFFFNCSPQYNIVLKIIPVIIRSLYSYVVSRCPWYCQWWHKIHLECHFSWSSPRQNGRHFADDIFRCIFLNQKFCILFKISLTFVPSDKNPVLVSIMAWRRIGDKPLFKPILTQFSDLLGHPHPAGAVAVGNAWIATEHRSKSLWFYLSIYTANLLLKFGTEVQSHTKFRVQKPKYPIWPPGSHFESDIAENSQAFTHTYW